MFKMIRGLAIAALIACSHGASAADVALGPLTPTSPLGAFAFIQPGSSFIDSYEFSITGPTKLVIAFVSSNVLQFPSPALISNFSASISGGSLLSPILLPTNVTLGRNSITYSADGDALLAQSALNYKFSISGNYTGAQRAGYTFQLSAAPVPEPESYILFLAGLGLLGTIVRRRSRNGVTA
jgi:hypothetical protein